MLSGYYMRLAEEERRREQAEADRAYERHIRENYEYGGYGMWYPKDGFGCGKYKDADGKWHSEM